VKDSKGFTLIEVIVVIFISFVMLNIFTLTLTGTDKRLINKSALSLQADLRLIQRLSVVKGKSYKIAFNIPANRYLLKEEDLGNGAEAYKTYKTVNIPSPVAVIWTNAKLNEIHYTSNGISSDPCTILLKCNKYLVELTVNVSSGRIDIKKIT
jgi:type II secretory pathway pseudopilin PulG